MFIALLDQGGGCDYTIGCDKNWVELKSESLEAAHKELADYIVENHMREEARLEIVTLLQAEEYDFDISAVYAEADDAKASRKAEKKAAEERAELERLKKKYGGD